MKHPWDKDFGKGSISEQCGWVCTVRFDAGDSNEAIYFDKEHGMCEMHCRRQPLRSTAGVFAKGRV